MIAVIAAVFLASGCASSGESPFFDRKSPFRVIDVVPPPDAAGVPVDVVVEAELGGEVDADDIESSFHLFGPGDAEVSATVTYANRVARLDPAAVLEPGTTYRAVLDAGIADEEGRPLQDAASWSFTTRTLPAGTGVVARVPLPDRSDVPLNFDVRIAFTEPLDETSIPVANALVVVQTNGAGFYEKMNGVQFYDPASRSLVFRPQTDAIDGMRINVSVTAALRDVYGRAVGAIAGWSFDTRNGIDIARPVADSEPIPAATPVETGGVLVALPADASDADWSDDEMLFELLVARERLSLPPGNGTDPGCDDPFDPMTFRAAEVGPAMTIRLDALDYGRWTMIMEVEDGSGRRSVAADPVTVLVSAGEVRFDAIAPILEEKCALAGCHDAQGAAGGLDLSGTAQSIKDAQSTFLEDGLFLKQVEPFCLERSYLFRKITPGYVIEGELMPPDHVDVNALSREEIRTIRAWIEQGAQD